MNVCIVSASDDFDSSLVDESNPLVDTVDNNGNYIYMGTNEMEIPSADMLNSDNFTQEHFEKEIKNPDEESASMVYKFDDVSDSNNSDVMFSRSSNYNIVINKDHIHQSEKLVVHFENPSNNAFIKLPQGTPIDFIINGACYTRFADSNGVCSININLFAQSTPYPVNISYEGDNQYLPSSVVKNIIVYRKTPVLTPINRYVVQHNPFYIKLTDDSGVPIANRDVTIYINGNSYIKTTNESGVAKLNINLAPNTYTLTYSFDMQNGYWAVGNQSLSFGVYLDDGIRNPTKLVALSSFIETSGYFNVKLTTSNDVALSGKTLIISVNGVNYSRVTNYNGVASLLITLTSGTYAVTVNFDCDSSYACSAIYHLIHTSNSDKNSVNTISDLTVYRTGINSQCNYTQSYIQELGAQLTSSCTSDLEKAIAIHNYIYNFRKDDSYYNARYGDLKAILVNDGDCVDHIQPFISLLRANGMAVRYVLGVGNPSALNHVWAQVLIDNTWIVADPTNTVLFGYYISPIYPNITYYSNVQFSWYDT